MSVSFSQIFSWENPLQSGMAFVGFLLGVYFFEIYMIPVALLGLFFKNYIVSLDPQDQWTCSRSSSIAADFLVQLNRKLVHNFRTF